MKVTKELILITAQESNLNATPYHQKTALENLISIDYLSEEEAKKAIKHNLLIMECKHTYKYDMSTIGGKTIASIYKICKSAHDGTSFEPERRGEQDTASLINSLKDTTKDLYNIEGVTQEDVEEVEAKAVSKYITYKQSQSRIISVMITGGSNFPNSRNQKANRATDKRREEYIYFLNNVAKRLKKKYKKEVDELQMNIDKLTKLEVYHKLMKGCNLIVRKKISDVEKIEQLVTLGLKESTAIKLLDQGAFEGFYLTNSNAKIKNTKSRIAVLEAKKAEPQEEELKSTDLYELIINREAERVQIIFDGKPDDEVRTILKANAFRSSPKNNAWQRKDTPNGIYAAKQACKLIDVLVAAED